MTNAQLAERLVSFDPGSPDLPLEHRAVLVKDLATFLDDNPHVAVTDVAKLENAVGCITWNHECKLTTPGQYMVYAWLDGWYKGYGTDYTQTVVTGQRAN